MKEGISYLVTWMYSLDAGDKVAHLQTGKNSDSLKVQNIYWRCLFCLFESSHRKNGDKVKHVLYVNKLPPLYIDGISTQDLIEKYKIEIKEFKTFTRPPKGYYKAWSTQFLILDILKDASFYMSAEDRLILLDGDCIFSKPLPDEFYNELDKEKALFYTIDYPIDHVNHELTLSDLRQITQEMSGRKCIDMNYQGGEIICLSGVIIKAFHDKAREIYAQSIKRFEEGKKKYNTEEPLFSAVSWELGLKSYGANPYIKRLWTDLASGVNLEENDVNLTIWHLPGEKKHGFKNTFRLLSQKNGYSLHAFENDLKRYYRIEPSTKDKLYMSTKGQLKKIYKAVFK